MTTTDSNSDGGKKIPKVPTVNTGVGRLITEYLENGGRREERIEEEEH